MIVSRLIPANERKRLGLPRKLMRPPTPAERAYLAEHRWSRFAG
jgi:hypothetical protein